jgi:hypothetical protein
MYCGWREMEREAGREYGKGLNCEYFRDHCKNSAFYSKDMGD